MFDNKIIDLIGSGGENLFVGCGERYNQTTLIEDRIECSI